MWSNRLWSSFLTKVSPEPSHSGTLRGEAIQVKGKIIQHFWNAHELRLFSTYRCTFVSCTKSFFNADKLKRHVRYIHGEKNKYFQVCPLDGDKQPHSHLKWPSAASSSYHFREPQLFWLEKCNSFIFFIVQFPKLLVDVQETQGI